MSKFTTLLVVALLTFAIGIGITAIILMGEKRELRILIPEGWGPDAFKVIDKRADEARLPRLRTIALPGDDLEVRVWVGFGINGEDALVLRRSSGRWSALHLHGMYEAYPPEKYQEILALPAPKSGWEAAWQRLVEAGVLTLPDASSARCEVNTLDGVSYGVEINMNKTYRIYSYDNPHHASCDQAKQMLKIGEIIAEEFSLEEFKIKE